MNSSDAIYLEVLLVNNLKVGGYILPRCYRRLSSASCDSTIASLLNYVLKYLPLNKSIRTPLST